MPTRNISLTAEQDAFVAELVNEGEYQNASEAVRDALRVLEQRRQEDALRLRALADLANILATSAERWGAEARRRYVILLATPLRTIAANPKGPLTQARQELAPRLRSFHLRHARGHASHVKVKKPVHVIYYRAIQPGLIGIVRVLHERMEPTRHLRGV